MPPGIVAAVVLKVGDASADFLLSSKEPLLGALGKDFLLGLVFRARAKEVAVARRRKKSSGSVALLRALVSPERRMSLLAHSSSRTTTRILSIMWRLVIHATGEILLIQYLVGVHLQLELDDDILEGTGWWA